MTVKLLTKQHLEFLSLTGGCTGSPESTLVKMPRSWKSRVVAHLFLPLFFFLLFVLVHCTHNFKKIILKNSIDMDQLSSGNA